MPEFDSLYPRWRRSTAVCGCVNVEVREPSYADVLAAASDDMWWVACVRLNTVALTVQQAREMEANFVAALVEDVCRPRPTVPQPGGCGD